MSDRVLTDSQMDALEEAFKDRKLISIGTFRVLCASHRLQAARIQELEERAKWLNDCIDERNSDVNEA